MIPRRQLLAGSLGGFFAFMQRHQLSRVVERLLGPHASARKAKRAVVLWMEGGPSQLDTFDPKPGTATGGPFQALPTAVAGMRIGEHLPRLASQMGQLSIVRNLTSDEGEHIRARYCMHTGFEFNPGFPRPSLGSVVSSQSAESEVPRYVALGSPGFGPAYMGPANAPFSVADHQQASRLIRNIRQRRNRIRLLQELDKPFNLAHDDQRVQQRRAHLKKIERLAATGFAEALDIQKFSTADQTRYGDTQFGRHCLIARKLLELGSCFVEVQLGGWDTHTNNFQSVKRLCGRLDKPMAALVEDLQSSGMFDDTLLIWMGEFGRTPNINLQNGRDHFPICTPVLLGGGPLRSGEVVGATNRTGDHIEGDRYRIEDLFATILTCFGIEPDQEFTTDFDSPAAATNNGRLISELI